jgi:hypothetical protein
MLKYYYIIVIVCCLISLGDFRVYRVKAQKRYDYNIYSCPNNNIGLWAPSPYKKCRENCDNSHKSIAIRAPVDIFQIIPDNPSAVICRCQSYKTSVTCTKSFWGNTNDDIHKEIIDMDTNDCSSLCEAHGIFNRTLNKALQVGSEPSRQCNWWETTTVTQQLTVLTLLKAPLIFKRKGEVYHSYLNLLEPHISCDYYGYIGCKPLIGTTFVWRALDEEIKSCHKHVLYQGANCMISNTDYNSALDKKHPIEVTCPNEKSSFSIIQRIDDSPCLQKNENNITLQTASGLFIDIGADSIRNLTQMAVSMNALYHSMDNKPSEFLDRMNYALKALVDSANILFTRQCQRICDVEYKVYDIQRHLPIPTIFGQNGLYYKVTPAKNGWCVGTCLIHKDWQVIKETKGLFNITYKRYDTDVNYISGVLDPYTKEILLNNTECLFNGAMLDTTKEHIVDFWTDTVVKSITDMNHSDWSLSGLQFSNILPMILDHSNIKHDVPSWYDDTSVVQDSTSLGLDHKPYSNYTNTHSFSGILQEIYIDLGIFFHYYKKWIVIVTSLCIIIVSVIALYYCLGFARIFKHQPTYRRVQLVKHTN